MAAIRIQLVCLMCASSLFIAARSSDVSAAPLVFTDAGRFERWSHFKDVGIPNTLTDQLNRAAIADGTCRLVTGLEFSGFRFWHHTQNVLAVLTALNNTPSTQSPSQFTLQAGSALAVACTTDMSGNATGSDRATVLGTATNDPPLAVLTSADGETSLDSRRSVQFNDAPGNTTVRPTFTVAARAAALDAWYQALCSPADAPGWGGRAHFDPAYMPAQIALTTGLSCIVACDTAGHQPSAKAMQALARDAVRAAAAGRTMSLCLAFNDTAARGYFPLPFAGVDGDEAKLRSLTGRLLTSPCGCMPAPQSSESLEQHWTVYIAGLVGVLVIVGCGAGMVRYSKSQITTPRFLKMDAKKKHMDLRRVFAIGSPGPLVLGVPTKPRLEAKLGSVIKKLKRYFILQAHPTAWNSVLGRLR